VPILREKLRQSTAKSRKNCETNAQDMRENNLQKNVFKDFCLVNTVRYKEVVDTAMFWHQIKTRCFVLCVLGEFSA